MCHAVNSHCHEPPLRKVHCLAQIGSKLSLNTLLTGFVLWSHTDYLAEVLLISKGDYSGINYSGVEVALVCRENKYSLGLKAWLRLFSCTRLCSQIIRKLSMGECTVEDKEKFFFNFFHTELAYKGYHISDLSAVQICHWNTKLIILGRGLGGDKVLWAVQMSKAQLTKKKKTPKTKKTPPHPLNHSLQLWNLLLTNVGISHLQVLPGLQVIELVCYRFQIGMTAGHVVPFILK